MQTRTEPASAAATRSSSSVILTISGALELDLYGPSVSIMLRRHLRLITRLLCWSEVAATLVRLVVAKPRPADALLLLTILSTPLTALKRRGYNIECAFAAPQRTKKAANVYVPIQSDP